MAYRDIKIHNNSNQGYKENLSPVFSDIIGETVGFGRLDNFIDDTENNLREQFENKGDDQIIQFKKELERLLLKYKIESDLKNKWLTLIGLLERKILQLRCYRNPTIAFTVQEQKSGDNIISYIVIRAQFIDLLSGKKEIRQYFNKLDDYPQFKSLDDLKQDPEFYKAAVKHIKNVMAEIIKKEGITLSYLENEFNKIHTPQQQELALHFEDEAKKKAKELLTQRKEESKDKFNKLWSKEQQEEIRNHRKKLRELEGEENEVYRLKEKDRHREKMNELKISKKP
jgi:hypothetical protein